MASRDSENTVRDEIYEFNLDICTPLIFRSSDGKADIEFNHASQRQRENDFEFY